MTETTDENVEILPPLESGAERMVTDMVKLLLIQVDQEIRITDLPKREGHALRVLGSQCSLDALCKLVRIWKAIRPPEEKAPKSRKKKEKAEELPPDSPLQHFTAETAKSSYWKMPDGTRMPCTGQKENNMQEGQQPNV
jgi:hypothetical protein